MGAMIKDTEDFVMDNEYCHLEEVLISIYNLVKGRIE